MNFILEKKLTNIMGWVISYLAALTLLSGTSYAAEGSKFLSDLDIPLMKNFTEDEDSRVVFDTPEGRIIKVKASGNSSIIKILDYYRVVLPSLSWNIVQGNLLQDKISITAEKCPPINCILAVREGEILIIMVNDNKGKNKDTIIDFSVSPE